MNNIKMNKLINEFKLPNSYLELMNSNMYDQYNHRYDIKYLEYDGINVLKKNTIDYYILSKIKEDKKFINTEECKLYFNKIKEIIKYNKYEFYTNIVLKEIFNNKNIYNDYFNNYKDIFNNNNYELNNINNIRNKIINNKMISQNELNTICGVMADLDDSNDLFYKDLIKYIINLTTNKNCKLKSSCELVSFFCTYIKYEYKNMLNNKEFNTENINVYSTDMYNGNNFNDIGQCLSIYNNYVLISRKFYSNFDLSMNFDFNNLINTTTISYKDDSNINLMTMIGTIFHELTHKQQHSLLKLSNFDEMCLLNVIEYVLMTEKKDYDNNYFSSRNEIDAFEQEKAELLYLIKKYLNNSKDKKNFIDALEYSIEIEYRKIGYAFKYDKNNKEKYEDNYYNISNLIKIFNNKTKRNIYFKTFPILKEIFLDNGKLDERILLGNKVVCNSNLGKDLTLGLIDMKDIQYLINYIDKYLYNSKSMNEYKKKSQDVIKYLLDTLEYRLYKISLIPDKRYEIVGNYKVCMDDYNNHLDEIKEYYSKFRKELDVVEIVVSKYGDKFSLIRLNNIIYNGNKLYKRKIKYLGGKKK